MDYYDEKYDILPFDGSIKHLSLHGLEPGTDEYKRVETILIKRICEIDLGDESRFERKETKKLTKKALKQQRKDFLKQFEGKLEEPEKGACYEHLKEGVEYYD